MEHMIVTGLLNLWCVELGGPSMRSVLEGLFVSGPAGTYFIYFCLDAQPELNTALRSYSLYSVLAFLFVRKQHLFN